jgi:hypothetical protein
MISTKKIFAGKSFSLKLFYAIYMYIYIFLPPACVGVLVVRGIERFSLANWFSPWMALEDGLWNLRSLGCCLGGYFRGEDR